MADAALSGAWDDGSPTAAAMAKAVAGRGARTAARHCQQVLAGIGFTTEHPFHRYLRRVLVLDQLFGSARSLTKDLGESIVASRRLPDLLPL
jgi:alkylation response protein AidB-like acyl-CoA dehydrogenase